MRRKHMQHQQILSRAQGLEQALRQELHRLSDGAKGGVRPAGADSRPHSLQFVFFAIIPRFVLGPD